MMDITELRLKITDLLLSTIDAHELDTKRSREQDPEWPIWYAGQLQSPLGLLLKQDFTRTRLIYCLMSADFEYQAMEIEISWPDYVARHLADQFAPSDRPEQDRLALYHTETCPYCQKVRRVIDKLIIDIELRDISKSPQDYEDLLQARKRATVPVLRITSADGEDRWMPESEDIISYLERNYSARQQG